MLQTTFLGYKDLIVTPLFLLVGALLIFYFKKFVPQKQLRPLFIKALFVKIFCGFILGVIYDFYYKGGDTMWYYHGGGVIYESFFESPLIWFKMVFGPMEKSPDIFMYANKIYHFGDSQSYFVIRICGFLSILSLNTYTTIAMAFALISFNGIWHLFLIMRSLYPQHEKRFGYACFYIPSLCFWGSGILKDSLLVAGVGWALYALYHLFFLKQRFVKSIFLFGLASLILLNIKPFVFIALFPPFIAWYILSRIRSIKSNFGRTLFGPIITFVLLFFGFLLLSALSKDTMFDINNINAITLNIKTSKDYLVNIANYQNGSAYDIGDLDGNVASTVALAPNAAWVTFFRPYIWESKNLIMLLAALESSFFLVFTFATLYKTGLIKCIRMIWEDPFLIFCLSYSIFYGIVIGLISGNFGTLVRYKIPVLPFFLCAIIVLYDYRKTAKKKNFTNPSQFEAEDTLTLQKYELL